MRVNTTSPQVAQNRNFQVAQQRLQALEDHVFVSLSCHDTFDVVSSTAKDWTESELIGAFPRIQDLASDPARGNKVTDGGLEEAVVALTAERQNVLQSVSRESTGGAEFKDGQGVEWDVKSPLSPPPDQNWEYSPDHQISRIRKDLSQGDKVLFNLSRVNDHDRDATLSLLKSELTCDERGQILILTDPEVAGR